MKGVRVRGEAELKVATAKVLRAVERPSMRGTVQAAAEDRARQAKGFAPVDTGELRDSIKAVEIAGQRKEVDLDFAVNVTTSNKDTVTTSRVVATADHASYVEYGTISAPAQPFMRPSVEAGRRPVKAKIVAGVKAAVKRATR